MILLLGGAGYIGSHVNKLLCRKDVKTVILDNLVSGHREFVKWGDFVLGDLENINQLRLIFSQYHFDAVMHFAAYSYVGESVENPQKYYINNVKNTLNLLQVMLENNVKKIIFSSTCATYGNQNELPINELHPLNPVNPYGQSKLMIENILKDYNKAYGMNYISLRYFNAAGADSDAEIGEWHNPETHLIPLVFETAIGKRESISIFGTDYDTKDGTCIRDYIHVTDLAHAHILALNYLIDGGESQIFNLGNGNGYSVKEIIDLSKKITHKPIPFKESARRKGDLPILVGDAKKIRSFLGWTPQYDLSDILKTAWKWHKTLY